MPAKSEGDLPTLGAPLSTREAMDKAVSWAVEGITFYQTGKWDDARKSFNDARLILLEADLPEFWKRQGLEAIRSGLPENLRHYDLEAVARELERTDRLNPAELAERAAIETEVRRILRQFGDISPEQAYLNVVVYETQQYISFYRGKYREFFERSFLRKHKYWPTIQEVFASRKLPGELGYIAFVESGFQPKAVSHANAHGLWQFIPETGTALRPGPAGGLLRRAEVHGGRGRLPGRPAEHLRRALVPPLHRGLQRGRGEDHELPAPDRRLRQAQLLGHPRAASRSRPRSTCPRSWPPR